MVDPGACAVVEHGGRVVDVVALVDEPDDRGEPTRRTRHLVERPQVGLDERALEEQVLGRITDDRELRERDEAAAECARMLHALDDFSHVAVEVPDRGVDLREPDPEASHAHSLMVGSRAMPAKIPWLPSAIPAGAHPERCPRCGRRAFIPWTLRREDATKRVLRTWVCAECQVTEERPEPE